MRKIAYKEIKKRLTIIGTEDGKYKWLFEPGTLNEGLPFWDYDYLDRISVYTRTRNTRSAVQLVGSNEGIRIVYPWKKH